MRIQHSTAQVDPAARRRYWDQAISDTYFPLELGFRNTATFSGNLEVWTLGHLSISRNVSDGLIYRRHKRHLLHEREESYLITVPEQSEISFTQAGKEVRCKPGTALVERSHLPYDFSHSDPNALWVFKVPNTTLRARVGQPERLASLRFDATRGAGALFVDMIRLTAARLDEMDVVARDMCGKHLVDLLALAIDTGDQAIGSAETSVRAAHLYRIERFIRANLSTGNLSPQRVADGCGVSVRYLHQLFAMHDTTVCGWIRCQRLLMCDESLSDPACRKSISEIAYRWGFGDQAQFSRHYRAQFGRTPSEAREAARSAASRATACGTTAPLPRRPRR